MRLLDRYIGVSVLTSVAGMLLLIVGLDVVFSFIGELEDLKNQYQMPQALQYILLTIPRRVYDYVPVATLIGCLIGLGMLANTSELTVIRAAGVSVMRIVWSAVKPVLLVVVGALVLGQYVVPKTEQYAQGLRTLWIDGSDTISSRNGFWYREGDEFFHVNAIQTDGVVYGLARYVFDGDQRLLEAEYAERGVFEGDHWRLENVRRTRFDQDHTQYATMESSTWRSQITPQLMSLVVLKPTALSLTDLYTFARYRDQQSISSGQFYYAFWKKTLQPATTIVMVFIAISFIFGPLRSVTMGQRLITGIIVGLVFTYAQDMLGHISVVYNVPPLIAAGLPIAIFLGVGIKLLRRV
ncbi:Predicted permease YjgP/YjgQ [gamma proteobacterium HdN1]|nr:Predicted permease YjgP/YjgQ [gamma proteobacterium HdN1]